MATQSLDTTLPMNTFNKWEETVESAAIGRQGIIISDPQLTFISLQLHDILNYW
jgi:hypothetical protein